MLIVIDPERVMSVEIWRDRDALAAHMDHPLHPRISGARSRFDRR
ncbi:antibiotic biosynthesis monooxygenase [Rhodococcoides yunnanense]